MRLRIQTAAGLLLGSLLGIVVWSDCRFGSMIASLDSVPLRRTGQPVQHSGGEGHQQQQPTRATEDRERHRQDQEQWDQQELEQRQEEEKQWLSMIAPAVSFQSATQAEPLPQRLSTTAPAVSAAAQSTPQVATATATEAPPQLPPLQQEDLSHLLWKHRATMAATTVWMWQSTKVASVNLLKLTMFRPLFFSLKSSFESAGATVIEKFGFDQAWIQDEVRPVAQSKNRRALVVVTTYQWNNCLMMDEMASWGAFVIGYQTEPFTEANVRGYVRKMAACKAREVWDYSKANMAQYSKDGVVLAEVASTGTVARWVPPGYTRLMDGGVVFDSRDRKEDQMGFLGFLKRRPGHVRKALAEPFWRTRLHESNSVWNIPKLAAFVNEYPLQLNVHKDQRCCPTENVMESFRIAQLAANQACILSAAVHPLDAAVWRGVVNFFDNFTEAASKYGTLRRDVRGCQKDTYNEYKKKFDSSKILLESGFLQMWSTGA